MSKLTVASVAATNSRTRAYPGSITAPMEPKWSQSSARSTGNSSAFQLKLVVPSKWKA